MSSIKHAVVVEPAVTQALSLLLEARPFGLLPAGSQTIIDNLLATLAAAGIERVDLLLTHLPHLTRAFVGSGSRWGVAISCHSIGDPDRLLARPERLRRYLAGDGIVLGVDVLVTVTDARAAIAAAAEGCTQYLNIHRQPLPFLVFSGESSARNALEMSEVLRIDTPRALWEANRRALCRHGDTMHVERRIGEGCYLGRGARVAASAALRGPLVLDAGVAVGPRAGVGPDVFVGADSIVDEGAEIARSIVLGGTYVGPHAVLRDKIVDGGVLVDVNTGETVYVDDPAIVGRVAGASAGRSWRTAAAEWFYALGALAVLAVPLALQVLKNICAGRPWAGRTCRFVPLRRALDGSVLYRKLDLWSVGGAWDRAPWLVAVLAGRLPLVGARLPLARAGGSPGDLLQAYGMLSAALALGATPHDGAADLEVSHMEYRLNAGPVQSWTALRNWINRSARTNTEGETNHA